MGRETQPQLKSNIVTSAFENMFKENVYHDKNKKKQYFAGVLISKNDSVLLGMKKRGFGSGLWNHSFAGKVEAGEEIASAARREVEEESGLKVDIDNLIKAGYFEFEFTDSSINPRIMAMTIYRALVSRVRGPLPRHVARQQILAGHGAIRKK